MLTLWPNHDKVGALGYPTTAVTDEFRIGGHDRLRYPEVPRGPTETGLEAPFPRPAAAALRWFA
ncbi:hypothetical protein GCM10022247_63340 [Allokutzneria multivorans]|uniref:Uncharacterized protein n=1 Tax=Allokutzneria multivorans TaxID=1142134 RepID=A0ABP7TQM5_9PSEU